jgi:hypothetical protein
MGGSIKVPKPSAMEHAIFLKVLREVARSRNNLVLSMHRDFFTGYVKFMVTCTCCSAHVSMLVVLETIEDNEHVREALEVNIASLVRKILEVPNAGSDFVVLGRIDRRGIVVAPRNVRPPSPASLA